MKTTLIYYRNMLAAAHILAMDAKNLLDVVDCIRERHSNVDWHAALVSSPDVHPQNQIVDPQNQITSPQNQTTSPQAQITNPQTFPPHNIALTASTSLEEPPLKPDFRINQPVTTGQLNASEHLPKEHTSLPLTSNRVSTLIHNYNLYGNVRDHQPIYGNSEVSASPQNSSSSIHEESKADLTPIESVKSRIQTITGKLESPPIYAVSKKVVSMDQNNSHSDQG